MKSSISFLAKKENTLPHMKIEKEIHNHPIHPSSHKLKLEYNETPFNCDGCKEAGIGLQYNCQECEFNLHKACALATQTTTHPFYKKCEFRLYPRTPGPETRICDACGDRVSGLVYHCDKCGFDLHPCCAGLPRVLNDGERSFGIVTNCTRQCCLCGNKAPGWAYRSSCKTYILHVSCVKELMVESWEALYLNVDGDRVKEMRTRIPSLKKIVEARHMDQRGGKMSKCCELVMAAVRLVVSAVLGDPTAVIAGVVQSFISK